MIVFWLMLRIFVSWFLCWLSLIFVLDFFMLDSFGLNWWSLMLIGSVSLFLKEVTSFSIGFLVGDLIWLSSFYCFFEIWSFCNFTILLIGITFFSEWKFVYSAFWLNFFKFEPKVFFCEEILSVSESDFIFKVSWCFSDFTIFLKVFLSSD